MKRFLFCAFILLSAVSIANADELNLQNIIKEGDYNTEEKTFQNLTEEQLDKELKNEIAFNSMPNYLNELFIKVVKHNPNPVLTKKLLSAGADVNYKNKYKDIPLVSAIQYNENPEIVKLLIKAGSNINNKNEFGRSAIFYSETVDVASDLVKAGADVNIKNDYGETPLMRALNHKHLDIARYLIDAGANVKISDNRRNTALVYLTSRGIDAPDIVQKMIDGGIDVNKAECEKPLDFAIRRNLKETEKLLLKAGAKVREPGSYCPGGWVNITKKSTIFSTMKEKISKSYIQFKDWLDEM